MNKEISAEMLRAAAAWHARLAAPDCSDQDKRELERWLAADHLHRAAFAQVATTDMGVTRAARHDPRLQALADSALNEGGGATRPASWPAKVSLALAASVLVLIGVLRLVPEVHDAPVAAMVYSTAPHETRDVTLSDGSIVHLDVGSTVRVQLAPDERDITLTAGRAYFQVAHDAARPFAVTANDVRTVALGTEFQVQSESGAVTVILRSGAVRVSDVSSPQPAWQSRLQPGEELRWVAGDNRPRQRVVDAESALSWTKGRLVFEATPLAQAVAEINRYSSRPLRLGDPTLGELLIGGSFTTGDSAASAAAICAVLPLEAVVNRDEIILFQRHD